MEQQSPVPLIDQLISSIKLHFSSAFVILVSSVMNKFQRTPGWSKIPVPVKYPVMCQQPPSYDHNEDVGDLVYEEDEPTIRYDDVNYSR